MDLHADIHCTLRHVFQLILLNLRLYSNGVMNKSFAFLYTEAHQHTNDFNYFLRTKDWN